jgi:hypothetical protein
MINLKQLLKEVEEDKKSNIASIEDPKEWKWPDVDHLFNMKFEREGDTTFVLKNPPIKIYKTKKGPFVVEEPAENHQDTDFKPGMVAPMKSGGLIAFNESKEIKKYQFETFTKVIEFFDKYQQDF